LTLSEIVAKLHSRRSPNFFPGLAPIPSPLACCSSVSRFPRHGILASLHPYFVTSSFPSPLAATLMHLPASVANKRLTALVSPLDATLTKNRGRGVLPTGHAFQFPFWNSPRRCISALIFNHFQDAHFSSPLFSHSCMEWGVWGCSQRSNIQTFHFKRSLSLSPFLSISYALLSATAHLNSFAINPLRTLFTTTEGAPPSSPYFLTSLPPYFITSPLGQGTTCPFSGLPTSIAGRGGVVP